jgi:archaellum biogenesis protein FlaJ (TadC family)
MNVYNKIMRLFWLVLAITMMILISYLSLTQGFYKWGFYYVFVLVAFGMFFFKSYMMKRMDRHLEYLAQQKEKTKSNEKGN